MRSPQLALCAAVAACAVTTAPAYGAVQRGAGTGTVSVTPASAERVPAGARTRAHTAPPGAVAGTAAASRALTPRALTSRALPSVAFAPVAFTPAHPGPSSRAAPRRELSSTSAVGLVLAGGAVLVIAGQLLRLRLRLRRERQGEADEH